MVRPKSAPRKNNQRKFNSKSFHGKNLKLRALQEIRYLSKTVHMLIPKLPFQRLVRSVCSEVAPIGLTFRIQVLALDALQEACEIYLSQLFEDCQLVANHAKRVTVTVPDMKLVHRIRGASDIINH